MKIQRYLEISGEPQHIFARRANITQQAVSRIKLGGDVRGRVWSQIYWATGGQVQPHDHFAVRKPRTRRGKG